MDEDLRSRDFVNQGDESEQVKKKRIRKTIGEEGNRKQTLIGLLVTVGLGLAFYLPPQIKQWWQGMDLNINLGKESEVIRIEKPVGDKKNVSEVVGFKVEIKQKEDAETVVKQMLGDLAGSYGLYVEKLAGGEKFGINEGEVFTAASVIKLPILVVYYQAVDKNQLDPKTKYVLAEEDRLVYGTGSMQNQPNGTKFSYQRIALLAANESDNMAAELLIKFLGGETKVQAKLTALGLKDTKIKENKTTPKEIADLLKRIYQGGLLSQNSREELMDNLTKTILEDRITAGVPSNIKVIHKFGSEGGVVNDCGIVEAKNPYTICVLSTGVNDGEAMELLPKISRVIWEWGSRD
ncbi:MAG: serine hydrolase [Candidatus Beckwithbacteria bacterium]